MYRHSNLCVYSVFVVPCFQLNLAGVNRHGALCLQNVPIKNMSCSLFDIQEFRTVCCYIVTKKCLLSFLLRQCNVDVAEM